MKQNQISWVLAAMLLGTASLAQAQYMWLDEKGLKQLSDQPPPPSVPQNRILKQPRQQGAAAPAPAAVAEDAAAAANQPASASAAKPKPQPPTIAERNADYNKRRADSQAAEEKSAQEAEQRAINAENCDITRAGQRALDDGVRVSTYDKSGQRAILTDAQRAEYAQRNQRILANCRK